MLHGEYCVYTEETGYTKTAIPKVSSWRADALTWIPTKPDHLSPESLGSPQSCTQQRGRTQLLTVHYHSTELITRAEPGLSYGHRSRSSPRNSTWLPGKELWYNGKSTSWDQAVHVEGPALCPVEFVILTKSWNNSELLSSSIKTGDHLAPRGCCRPRLGCPRRQS